MSKTTSFIITLVLSLSINSKMHSQNISWSNNDGFTNTIITIQTTTNQETRYNNALNYFSKTHTTTKQLQDVLFYMNNDQRKYNLCLSAYPNIIDKNNFINIYNSFSKVSNAIKLYRDTQGKDELLSVQYNYELGIEQNKNAKYDLLMHQGDILLSANKFDEAITAYLEAKTLNPNGTAPDLKIKDARKWQQEFNNINNQQNQNNAKFDALIQQGDHLLAYNLFNEAILSYEQAMALKPGDQTAYARIKEANRRKKEFEDAKLIELDEEEIVETIEIIEETCFTEESKFSHILSTIESQTFSRDMKEMTKKQVSKNCLSIDQFKKIVPLFSMDDDKLEMIKFYYDYAEYPDKMYLFRELLTFSSSKKEFDDFLINKE
jgi:tetratricopeptide (TPR) repeat protein